MNLFLIEKHGELSPRLAYRCVTAPRAYPEWVSQVRLGKYWPRSTVARYKMLMFGEYVRHLRQMNSSRRRVAQYCNVGITTVRDWEIRGKLPNSKHLPALADVLTTGSVKQTLTMGSTKQTLAALTELYDEQQSWTRREREEIGDKDL